MIKVSIIGKMVWRRQEMRKEAGESLDMIMSGEVLNHMIRKRGYTVSEIQKELNLLYPQSIYRWLSGQSMPSIDNLYKLSAILQVHMEDLLMPRRDDVWVIQRGQNRSGKRRYIAYRKRYRKIIAGHR